MAVSPGRMPACRGAGGIKEALLGKHNKRRGGHHAAVDLAERSADLYEGVTAPEQGMDLNDGGRIFMKATEGDPARKDMPLNGHEAEGCLIGVYDHDACCHDKTSLNGQIEQRRRPRSDRSIPGGKQAIAFRPEVGEFSPPEGDDLKGLQICIIQAQAVSFIPKSAKAVNRAGWPPADDINIHEFIRNARDGQTINGLRPTGRRRLSGVWQVWQGVEGNAAFFRESADRSGRLFHLHRASSVHQCL